MNQVELVKCLNCEATWERITCERIPTGGFVITKGTLCPVCGSSAYTLKKELAVRTPEGPEESVEAARTRLRAADSTLSEAGIALDKAEDDRDSAEDAMGKAYKARNEAREALGHALVARDGRAAREDMPTDKRGQ